MSAPDFTREHYLELAVRDLPVQLQGASNMIALLEGIAGLLWDEIIQPLARFAGWPDPANLEGFVLDDLAGMLGLGRPRITAGDYFGFHGTASEGGHTFNMAPFFGERGQLENSLPIGDELMRFLLIWRARVLFSSPTHKEIGDIFAETFPQLTISADADGEISVDFGTPASGFPSGGITVLGLLPDAGLVFPERTGRTYDYS